MNDYARPPMPAVPKPPLSDWTPTVPRSRYNVTVKDFEGNSHRVSFSAASDIHPDAAQEIADELVKTILSGNTTPYASYDSTVMTENEKHMPPRLYTSIAHARLSGNAAKEVEVLHTWRSYDSTRQTVDTFWNAMQAYLTHCERLDIKPIYTNKTAMLYWLFATAQKRDEFKFAADRVNDDEEDDIT